MAPTVDDWTVEIFEFLRTKMEIPEDVTRLELIIQMDDRPQITCTYYPRKAQLGE